MFKFILLFLFSISTYAQVPQNYATSKNLILNPEFELGPTTGWKTNGTLGIDSGTTVISGKQSGSWSSTTGQYLESNLVGVKAGLANQQCKASIKYASTNPNFYLTVFDSSAEIIPTSSRVVATATATSTEVKTLSVLYPCGAWSENRKLRVIATGTNTSVKFDDAYLGLAEFEKVSNNPSILGTLKYLGAASCGWNYNSASWGAPAANTNCSTPIVTGQLIAPATKILSFTLPRIDAGTLKISYKARLTAATASGDTHSRFTDGTNYSTISFNGYNSGSWAGHLNGSFGTIEYPNGAGQTTISLQLKGNLAIDAATNDLEILVEHFPKSSSSTVVNARCPSDIACEKTISATVTSAGVVDESDYDWINGNATFTSGTATINLNSIGITQPMKCGATIVEPGATASVRVQSVSTSQIVINTFNLSSTGVNVGFKLDCTKSKADYKPKQVIQGQIGNQNNAGGFGTANGVNTSGVLSKLLFNSFTTTVNGSNMIDIPNSKVVIKSKGQYKIDLNTYHYGAGTVYDIQNRIYINGAPAGQIRITTGTYHHSLTNQILINLNENDFIEFFGAGTGGFAGTAHEYNFSVVKIGD